MTRTTRTTTAPAADTTAPVADAVADVATDRPDVIRTAADYAATEPNPGDIVGHYMSGIVTRPAAVAYANDMMGRAVVAGTAAATAGDTAAMVTAMTDAGTWSGVVTALGDARRTPVRTGPTVDDYVTAAFARGIALHDAARDVLSGATVPADVPDDMHDTYRDALANATTVDYGSDTYRDAYAHANAYAGRNVRRNGGIPTEPHFAAIAARTAVGTFMTFAEIANATSDVYPSGIAGGSGRIAARFVDPRTNVVKSADRYPAGWTYAPATGTRARGAIRVAIETD